MERIKGGTCYPINDWTTQPGPIAGFPLSIHDHCHMLDKLQYPTETIIVFEIADEQDMTVLNDHTGRAGWPNGARSSTTFSRIATAAIGKMPTKQRKPIIYTLTRTLRP